MKLDGTTNKSVAYSRAGDAFHYRWAARRCLRLIQSTSKLKLVVIEGSKEREKAGEYVIDVSEYYDNDDSDKRRIEYYQLKHTTVRHDKPFTLSGLRDTIIGFSKRFQQHTRDNSLESVSFTVITNRKISSAFKENLAAIICGTGAGKTFDRTIKSYTTLEGDELSRFCSLLRLEDGEGDYEVQKRELRIEMSRLQPGVIDSAQVDSIVTLVEDRVLPHSDGKIIKEDILRPFGVTSEKQLFPAPAIFEELQNITVRSQYHDLLDTILHKDAPLIIQAEGGVGKSVFSRYVTDVLPENSLGVAYDCFGSGKYRSRSEPRHRHRDALVQISNELASLGLCERMLIKDTTQDSDIMHSFLSRIKLSAEALHKVSSSAKLVILIDAADNAEMAAQEIGDSCFVSDLLRETFPANCKIVLLCRPERTHLLNPSDSIRRITLLPFTKEETFKNLKKWYAQVSDQEAYEFHRLTNGNPRVQMNAITAGHSSVGDLLLHLGPFGTTVEKQIEQQLFAAVQKVKDLLPRNYQVKVDKICIGLATLPPNIPIQVLSKISQVDVGTIRSFVADIGRSLRLIDSSIQFIDEPTETWFRNTFLGSKKVFESYTATLEPLANDFVYVAQVLPQLYLQAGQYDRLISIALSEDLLPSESPIDYRNVLVYRLQFAFKAALRSQKYTDAIKLALRAGEEVAGDQRQQDLFRENIDLLAQLQDTLKVQEIAFTGRLESNWEGSENVFAASLLSEVEEYKGEASGYLRSAMNWLGIYFQEARKREDRRRDEGVDHGDILEMAIAHLNLTGVKSCLNFLSRLKPKLFIFQVMTQLTRRLIDAGRFEEIKKLLRKSRSHKFHIVAITSELVETGRFAKANDIEKCLISLSKPKKRIKQPLHSFRDNVTPAVISFLEVCLHRKLSSDKILKALDYYVPPLASQLVGSRSSYKERTNYLKALAVRRVLSNNLTIDLEELMPSVYRDSDKSRDYSNDIREFKDVVGGLYPWYLLRVQVIFGQTKDLLEKFSKASEKSKKARINRYRSSDFLDSEVFAVTADILALYRQENSLTIHKCYDQYLKDNSLFSIPQRISLMRSWSGEPSCSSILRELETSTYELIQVHEGISPEEIANQYISLARAVISGSKRDAAVYFEEAIRIVSKFGDEIVERWKSIEALGERSVSTSDELAYRFIRCSEVVGEYVYEEEQWDRSRALVTCAKMSPPIAISALSRWRDRDVGRFDYQLETLLEHLVGASEVAPVQGWSMARLLPCHELKGLLPSCLDNEPFEKVRAAIFTDAYELVAKEESYSDYWDQLKSVTDKYNLSYSQMRRMEVLDGTKADEKDTLRSKTQQKVDNNSEKRWTHIFQGVDLLTSDGIASVIERFSHGSDGAEDYVHRSFTDLYNEIFKRIEADEVIDFTDALFNCEEIDIYDCQKILTAIPDASKTSISFKRNWPSVIKRLGNRYAHSLSDLHVNRYIVKELAINPDLMIELRKGIFAGLSQGQNLIGARVFFGFVRHAAEFIQPQEASNLTDYALARFELHVENDFGDGPWEEWLHVSSDIETNIAGFIWSALGSPRSETRWRACHVVKKLGDFNCTFVLDALIEWSKLDQVRAFGSKQFPFYNLHARQYLLIALARVSIDHPSLLIPYKEVFANYAQSTPHILIQHFAAKLGMSIEEAKNGTYISQELSALRQVSEPKQGIKKEDYDYRIDSYLHSRGEVDTTLDFFFGWDFDQYWFQPLGGVFGVSAKQIKELCANVIVKEWGLTEQTGYYKDPRVNLWNNSQGRETHHDHGSYPITDNWDFYVSYHSMMSVAAKLIENMPVIGKRDWGEEDSWKYWLSLHLLARPDGKWLADRRDPLPSRRPEWVTDIDVENWRTDIQGQDFLDAFISTEHDETWLHIKGRWTERRDSKYEKYSVSTALVSRETSEALQRALATCSDSSDYKIPDFEERSMEFDSGKFRLKGWIHNPDHNNGLDERDPYGNNLRQPPFSPGKPYLDKLKLTVDREGKKWTDGEGQLAMKCDTWSSNPIGYDKEVSQEGMRLSASLKLLKGLCEAFDCDLIIKVNVSRNIDYKYQSNKEEYKYVTHHQVYLFSADGRLRTTTQSFSLGPKDS